MTTSQETWPQKQPQKQKLLRVLGDLSNGQLASSDEAWLQETLTESATARALYMDYMELDACLDAEGSALANQTVSDQSRDLLESNVDHSLVTLARELVHNADARSGFGQSGLSTARDSKWRGSPAWAVAVALAGVALFSSALTYSLSTGQSGRRLLGGASDQVVARVTGTQNSVWKDEASQRVGYGSELVAGQELTLEEGIAEVTFQDGATVLLESPARFVVNAPHEVQLHEGRMAAVVPAQSRGFRVHTKALDVFDVGTEFGLMAQSSGASELHVFNGVVKADVLDSGGRALRRLELNSSEAARVNPISTTVAEFPADVAAFVRSLEPTTGPRDGLLAYEGFDYPEGPLDEQNGGFGWAGPWFSIAADSEAGPDSNRVGTGSLTARGIVPVGNRAVQSAQQNRIRRTLATSVGSIFDAAGLVESQDDVRLIGRDGKHVYVSFVQRVSATGDNFYGFELHRSDGNANRVLSIGHGAENTAYGVTSNYNVYGVKNFPDLGEENTEENLFVVKITFGVENRDVVEVYRNPESLRDELACSVDAVLKGNFAFDRISMASFHGAKIHEIDEVHVGTHFLAVTGRWGGKRGLQRHVIAEAKPRMMIIPRNSGVNLASLVPGNLFD
ncbi:MAG: FecR domain-containing protein [Bythopirellula sp.]|nr:FecR domain-containing protein [Bythopirellula sp.]